MEYFVSRRLANGGRLYAHGTRRFSGGFTLLELLIGSAILTVAVVATLGVLWHSRVQSRKAMERDIMLDFAQHYLELARAQQFEMIAPGYPINTLYDGTRPILLPDGTEETCNIRFPDGADANPTEWLSLYTNDFRLFHPDLEWFSNREPAYICSIATQVAAGEVRARQIRLQLRWRPPLERGNDWMTLEVDTVVYPEFS